MTITRTTVVAMIASGDLLSAPVALHSAKRIAIVAPVGVTSAQLFVRPATDVTSAGSARAFNRGDGTPFAWQCGSAGGYLEITDLVGPASHVRIEAGVAQTSPKSFQVLMSR